MPDNRCLGRCGSKPAEPRHASFRSREKQSGAAIVEYMVVALAMVAALFFKYDGQHSVIELLAAAVVDYFRYLTFMISMP